MKNFLKTSVCIVLMTFFGINCTSQQKIENEFTISGSVIGDSTNQILLYYTDLKNMHKVDTILVHNGTFQIKGHLNNPQKVAIVGNVKENIYDNPNIARFYLGYDDVNLELIEDEFNKTEVQGSSLQNEHINLFRQVKPIYEMFDPILAERKVIQNERIKKNNDSLIEDQLRKLSQRQSILLDSIRFLELNYAWGHPDSYLSPDLISFYQNEISKDSLLIYYNNFTPRLKTSFQAKTIKEFLNLNVTELSIGNQAPDFVSKDPNGNDISLAQFKGKYVLLDFWAGWCKPCKEKHPELKRLYKIYHSKGLEIIGVSFDKDEKSWRDNIKNEDMVWQHVFDGLRNIKKDAFSVNYSHNGIPAYFLIDKEGVLIGRYLNADSENKDLTDLEKKLGELLK